MKKILILGVNGFIGHHLSKALLNTGNYEVYGLDMSANRLGEVKDHPNFHFFEGDVLINSEWIEYHVKKCDVVLPLVAIATPALYVSDPLRVFELDFESNLKVVRQCVKYGKRVIFPSTSEFYGMCPDGAFHPYESTTVYGPVHKKRWIYAASKQLLDRVIYAYGEQGLDYTLFRPFNWIGPGLDQIESPKEGSSRVLTQFLGDILRQKNIQLVDGGAQRRCFTYIEDGINALLAIIANEGGVASGKIYNIGNPHNDCSIKDLAELMLDVASETPYLAERARAVKTVETHSDQYYGKGFQDVAARVPWIDNTVEELKWKPRHALRESIAKTFEFYEARHASDSI
jgi:nucleoside-diphosphate-sugar epimerase